MQTICDFVPVQGLRLVGASRAWNHRTAQSKEEQNRRRDDILHELVGSNSFNYGDELERGIKDAPDVKVFILKAIMAATSNFSNENKLGQGGYGPVYKGILPDGREIAVKRLSKTSGQGIKEFKNELILISKLQQTNLVRLYGCCIHQEEKMLIYELLRALGESYDVKQLLRAIHIGLLCVQENANDRPTISEVISMLNNEITDLPIPKQPAFFIHPDEVQQSRPSEHLLGNNIQGSVNGLTITTMQAR